VARFRWDVSVAGTSQLTLGTSYVPASAGQKELDRETAEGLKALIDVALEISNLKEFLGREKPTVITVRRRLRDLSSSCGSLTPRAVNIAILLRLDCGARRVISYRKHCLFSRLQRTVNGQALRRFWRLAIVGVFHCSRLGMKAAWTLPCQEYAEIVYGHGSRPEARVPRAGPVAVETEQ
jgi:hypothetical protein